MTMTVPKWRIADRGSGVFLHKRCASFVPPDKTYNFAHGHHKLCMRCDTCNEIIFPTSAQVELFIEADSALYMEKDTVISSTWYHITENEHWMEDLASGEESLYATTAGLYHTEQSVSREDFNLMVHLGTRSAALDRARIYKARPYRRTLFLYEVQIASDAAVSDHILSDENSLCPITVRDAKRKDGYSEDITRYVNAYESPGSISLLANRAKIEIVTREIYEEEVPR